MPLYEYRCQECGHQFEKLVFAPLDSDEVSLCPKCGMVEADRIISGSTFRLLGTGWDKPTQRNDGESI